jgi:hypothetical protein
VAADGQKPVAIDTPRAATRLGCSFSAPPCLLVRPFSEKRGSDHTGSRDRIRLQAAAKRTSATATEGSPARVDASIASVAKQSRRVCHADEPDVAASGLQHRPRFILDLNERSDAADRAALGGEGHPSDRAVAHEMRAQIEATLPGCRRPAASRRFRD